MDTTTPLPAAEKAQAAELETHIGAQIRNIGIPPRPLILTRIHNEMLKDEPDFRLLADIIGSDVGLSAGVMKVANSPYFGFGKKVRSVPEALLVLGLKVTVQTIAGIELRKTFKHVPSLERFWDSAARSALLCAWLVQQLQDRLRLRADDAYTFGLFRDCGIPVLMIPFPEYAGILKRANAETTRSFTAIEDEVLSLNHAQVGAELGADWLMPEDICQAIRHHHEIGALRDALDPPPPRAAVELIAIAHVAEHLIQKITGWNKTEEWGKLGAASMDLLGVNDEDMAQLELDAGAVANQSI